MCSVAGIKCHVKSIPDTAESNYPSGESWGVTVPSFTFLQLSVKFYGDSDEATSEGEKAAGRDGSLTDQSACRSSFSSSPLFFI